LTASPVDASLLTPFGLFTLRGLRPQGLFTAAPVDASLLTPCGLFTLRWFLTNDSTCEAAVNNEVSTAKRKPAKPLGAAVNREASTAKRNRLAKNANF
jgi:hypothetical protein